jgi:hypothetical protein
MNLVVELDRLLDREKYLVGPADFAVQPPFGIRAHSQDLPMVWLLARDRGAWPDKPKPIEGRNEPVPLPGLGIELSMAALDHGIPDPA